MALQVSSVNDVKVYNISTGKSLPEWISERKKRSLLRNDEGLRRRIELIQDFKMPTAATHVTMTPDRGYIFTAGVYKPRVRCYDTTQLSMKFERCVDHEVVAMTILSEDYSKFVLLQNNRNIEFHVKHGLYHSVRIPKFGRDLSYHYPSCDLYIPSSSPEIYRINLEQGQFLSPVVLKSKSANVSTISNEYQLLTIGTSQGLVECIDPRSRNIVGSLPVIVQDQNSPVTALKFNKGGLTIGVGTESGHVLLYDIRSSKPYCIKDHHYQLPINSIYFHSQQDLVLSSDNKSVRIWNNHTCEPVTNIEPENNINSMYLVPDTGLIFIAVEHTQLLSYFIPSLGTAPRWCSYLDNLTEELEETPQTMIYDDYKFVTRKDLDDLGLSHLIGTNVLRAYMHGYFMDIRLYRKAKSIAEPFAYEEYRQKKIQEKIDMERINRVQKKKLPAVNRELVEKLTNGEVSTSEGRKSKKKKTDYSCNLLNDERFSALFTNPDYQVDTSTEEYKLLNPLLSQSKKLQEKTLIEEFVDSDSNDKIDKPYQQIHKPNITLVKGNVDCLSQSNSRVSLGKRIDNKDENELTEGSTFPSTTESTFTMKKSNTEITLSQSRLKHRAERKGVRRSAGSILLKRSKSVYWKGKRIK